jgi:hypothetical protein
MSKAPRTLSPPSASPITRLYNVSRPTFAYSDGQRKKLLTTSKRVRTVKPITIETVQAPAADPAGLLGP